MKIKTTVAVLALLLSPTFAFAQCMGDHKEITASSCKDGSTYDAEKGVCVLTPST